MKRMLPIGSRFWPIGALLNMAAAVACAMRTANATTSLVRAAHATSRAHPFRAQGASCAWRTLRVVSWFLAVLLAMPIAPAFGTSFAPKNFDQLVGEAEEIFVGTVSAATSRKLPTGGIVTDVAFTNLQVLKGNTANTEITLMVLGGTVGEETLVIRGVPKFQMGITYLVFVEGNGKTIFPVVGGDQGMFQIRRDPATGEDRVFNSRGMPITSVTAGPDATVSSATTGGGEQMPVPVTLGAVLQAIKDRLGR